MPIHIGEVLSEVNVAGGEMPLTEAQIATLVNLVLAQLERRQKNQDAMREATAVRAQSAPSD